MQGLARKEQAKAELDAILSSGLFAHAPSLAQFLSYICAKCLDGETSQIKEYNIAVEALGRTPDFDQKRDSIVRVEAHRLRKRLRQYYEEEGASHSIQIVIPAGQYVPQFVLQEDARAAVVQTVEAEDDVESIEPPLNGPVASLPEHIAARRPLARRTLLVWLGGTAAVLASLLGVWRFAPQLQFVSPVANAESPELPPLPGLEGQEIRLLAGSNVARYVDHFGNTWTGDRFFKGGAVFSAPSDYHIIGTQDPVLFQSRREGIFSYDIPLKPGVYELHLYFAETLFGDGNIAGGGETYRLFDILANGKPLVSGLDVITDAPGANTADIKVYKDISPAPDGFLHLTFPRAVKENSFLNAIEILPGIPGRLRPVRIVARDTSVNTTDGKHWGADSYFIRGQRVRRADSIKGAADPELYTGERYGNFVYSIPVAPGRYTATLLFCETWFGPKKPAGGGAGDRVFDVHMNGTALLRNFDIFKEAGGEDRPLRKVFHSLQPNAQGKLVFSFVPVRNYACINAIEIVDEGR
jgi:hypothetical protein